MKLGSLFDGIGGFPLAGVMCGIEPVWASEIEPFPILTTHTRFPSMKHVGSVTDINGAEVEPVDIITFGSPCQDLSVAGKQAGIHDGERSNLFFEAVRIIKEMRANDKTAGRADELCRPRFAVWENVPGAFSSNKGADFQAVLQALAEVRDTDVSVPLPDHGKWQKAGCIVGEGWSIAWRVYDAQFWGVPQRRKRIYLIADFGSERAGEILFESEGMRGNPAQSGTPWQGTSADAEGSAGGGRSAGFVGGQGSLAGSVGYEEERSPTLRSAVTTDVCYQNTGRGWWNEARVAETLRTPCGGDATKANLVIERPSAICLQGNNADRDTKQNGRGWTEKVSYTLNTIDRPAVVFPDKARTLTAEHDSSPCIDRGQNVVALDCRNLTESPELSGTLQAKSQGGYSLNYQNPVVYPGVGITSPANGANPHPGDPCGTLSTDNRNYLVYDARGNGDGEITPTLTGDHQNRIPDYTGIAVQGFDMQAFGKYSDCGTSSTLKQRDYKDATDLVVEHGRHYIVRRLMPLECCRLQGYPDGWTENLAITNPTGEEIDFFVKVWSDWAAINGTKPKSRSQVIKWLADPQIDSAEYKAYGNSLAIPCAYDVIRRVAMA